LTWSVAGINGVRIGVTRNIWGDGTEARKKALIKSSAEEMESEEL